jgi:hypothetical protein
VQKHRQKRGCSRRAIAKETAFPYDDVGVVISAGLATQQIAI